MATIQKFVIPAAGGRNAFTIYSVEGNINYFLKTALTLPRWPVPPTNRWR
jgi:hypothetical protein